MKINHTPGPEYHLAEKNDIRTVEIDLFQAPHDCDVHNCPGRENKRKLELFDAMLAALEETDRVLRSPTSTVSMPHTHALIKKILGRAKGVQK